MMLNCIKESFSLTNKYIIIATPLILFSLLSSLYILFSIGGSLVSLVVAGILFVLMLGAFLSGWFYMIKTCIIEEREDANSLIKEFAGGVGEYFLPTLGLIFVTFIVSLLLLIVAYWAGMKYIGNIGISADALSKAMESVNALKTFLSSLSEEQLFKLNAWNFLLFGTMAVTYFVIMLYSPVMFFKEKNPLKAYFFSLRDLFGRKFFKNLMLYLLLFISYFILSVFTTIFGMNIIMHFLFTLINFYYLVYAAILVFYYYYSNFIRIGGNLDERV